MILCIEDSPSDSTLLFRMLRISTDRALLFVPGRKEAVAALAKLNIPPVVILCDLLMRGNGHATIRWLREQYPSVPVVVVTALDGPEHAKAIAEGAYAVIDKGTPGLSIRLHDCFVELGIESPR